MKPNFYKLKNMTRFYVNSFDGYIDLQIESGGGSFLTYCIPFRILRY